MNDGGPAFPWEDMRESAGQPNPSSGMTLRDYFAAQTIKGKADFEGFGEGHAQAYAKDAYAIADAMLAAREQNPTKTKENVVNGKGEVVGVVHFNTRDENPTP